MTQQSYEEHKAWEEEQSRLASESAKAMADAEAMAEQPEEIPEPTQLRGKIARIIVTLDGTCVWDEQSEAGKVAFLNKADQIIQACQETHDKAVREIFEEIEDRFFVFDADGNLLVKAVFSQRDVNWWQALKKGFDLPTSL